MSEKTFIEKLELEIKYTQSGITTAEESGDASPETLSLIYRDKAFLNGLIRAKRLFEGAPTNV